MCGIAGFVSKNAVEGYGASLLEKMKRRIAHRGPDSNGSYYWNQSSQSTALLHQNDFISDLPFLTLEPLTFTPKLALGHNRLAIQDLSYFGHQPMSDENGENWIVLNGEIFNFKELREDLVLKGYTFFSITDTEVILKGYKEYGIDILNLLDGFYSFALFDKKNSKLILSRDFTGVKPMYFYDTKEAFAFGSEIKAFFDLPNFKQIHNKEVIQDFLVHEKIEINRNTFYENVFKVMPGEVLEYNLEQDEFSLYKYNFKSTEKRQDLKEKVVSTVKSRLLSDVPIGFALSGGVDSTLIASISASFLEKEIKLFSANSKDPEYDESKWQEIANNKIKGEWNKTFIDTQLIDFKKINYLQDCPIVAANNIANYQLYATVKDKGVKVLVNGQGADELFTGYPIYFAYYYLFANKEDRIELVNNIANAPITLAQLKRDVLTLRFKRYFPVLFNKVKIRKKSYNKYLARPIKTGVKIDDNLQELNSVLAKDYYGQRLQEMLHWEDRNSMAFGIESRNPFADCRVLAELALALPIKEKIRLGWSKYFLRNNFNEFLPQEIRERKDKKGFSMPDIEWNRKWEKEIRISLCNEKLKPYINTNKIITDFDRLVSSNDIHLHKFLFRTMSLSHFLDLEEYIHEMA